MTVPSPVALPGPPYENPQPRVTVTQHPSSVNAGDGRETWFVLRFVVESQSRLQVAARSRAVAARRAAALVREREPRAVWLLDADRTAGGLYEQSETWWPLALAARDVQAAYVAWHAA